MKMTIRFNKNAMGNSGKTGEKGKVESVCKRDKLRRRKVRVK
jgi:hypothetical protein